MTDNAPATPQTETKLEQFERERLTRRTALKKLGMTTGMTLFSLFAVDDLARLAIKRMEEHKETRMIAETVAKEFKDSGIAFAGGPSWLGCGGCQATCVTPDIYHVCFTCTTPCSGLALHDLDCTGFIIPAGPNQPRDPKGCFACCSAQSPGMGLSAIASRLVCNSYCD